jgi:hypothetical protein
MSVNMDNCQWRPISEIHEDFGDCILMNIYDPGDIQVGGNLDNDWDENLWTHFSKLPPLTEEQAEELIRRMEANDDELL